jgi:hypothetical protein
VALGIALMVTMAGASPPAADEWSSTWQSGQDKSFAYGLVDPNERMTFVYGQEKDFTSVGLTRDEGRPVLWARIGSKRYLIDDGATFREAKAIVEPALRIAREQGRLGSLQGELGNTQGKVGNEQGKIGHTQGKLGNEQAKLANKQVAAALEDDDEAQEYLTERQKEIGATQQELGRRQADLGKHQASMGEVQADLGRRQAELAEEQSKLQPGVNAKMKKLLQQSVKDGRARPI